MAFGIDDMFGAGIGMLGGMINNIMSGQRQEDQQRFNAEQQRLSQQFNAEQAGINRQWSGDQNEINRQFQTGSQATSMNFAERMRNTQWQAGMADMRAAGMNPILAYSKGGAAAPTVGSMSGSSGGGGAASSGAASSGIAQTFDLVLPALSTAKAVEEIENLRAQRAQTNAQVKQTEALTRTEGVRAGLVGEQTGLTQAETRRLIGLQPAFEAEGAYGKTKKEFHESMPGKILDLAGLGGNRVGDVVGPVGKIFGGASGLLKKLTD